MVRPLRPGRSKCPHCGKSICPQGKDHVRALFSAIMLATVSADAVWERLMHTIARLDANNEENENG